MTEKKGEFHRLAEKGYIWLNLLDMLQESNASKNFSNWSLTNKNNSSHVVRKKRENKKLGHLLCLIKSISPLTHGKWFPILDVLQESNASKNFSNWSLTNKNNS